MKTKNGIGFLQLKLMNCILIKFILIIRKY